MVDHAQGWQSRQSWRGRRLLGQSCLPQPFGAVEVHPVAPDPVAAKIVDARVLLIDRGAAALAASLEPAQHEHPIAEIAKLRSDVLELLPVLARVCGEPFDALASAVDGAIEGPDDSRVPLEVGGQELGERAIDVAAVGGLNHA